MKRKYCFFLLLFLIVFIPHKTKALCDDSEYIRLSKLAQNVKIAYTYDSKKNNFTITITNLKKDLRIEYLNELKKYNTDKEINIYNSYSGQHTFMIYATKGSCAEEHLTTRYINLPFRNPYSESEFCKGIENYVYCQKWSNRNDNKEMYYKKILEYKKELENKQEKKEIVKNNENAIFKFIREKYVEYYHIILPAIISILCLAIYIKNKKESLV